MIGEDGVLEEGMAFGDVPSSVVTGIGIVAGSVVKGSTVPVAGPVAGGRGGAGSKDLGDPSLEPLIVKLEIGLRVDDRGVGDVRDYARRMIREALEDEVGELERVELVSWNWRSWRKQMRDVGDEKEAIYGPVEDGS